MKNPIKGTVVAVGVLLYQQMKMVISNLTGIEQWILEKAKWRRKDILKTDDEYIFPYDLGWERDLL